MVKSVFQSRIPRVVAMIFGLLTLIGLLVFPQVAQTVLGWGSFLVAIALLIGVLNLIRVHARRKNFHSIVLLLSLFSIWGAAALDAVGAAETDYVGAIFNSVIVPAEAAIASLVAFFLLFAGFRLLRRQQTVWHVIFLSAILVGLLLSTPLPAALDNSFGVAREYLALVTNLVVTSGMRGILIGVALATIMLSIRLLNGSERPYSK